MTRGVKGLRKNTVETVTNARKVIQTIAFNYVKLKGCSVWWIVSVGDISNLVNQLLALQLNKYDQTEYHKAGNHSPGNTVYES